MKLNSCFASLSMLPQYRMQKVARASERRCAQLVKNRRRPRSPTPTHQTCKNLHQGVPAARSGHYCTHISPFTRSRRTSAKAATQDSASRVALAQQQGCLSDAFAVSRCCGSRVVLVPKFALSRRMCVRAWVSTSHESQMRHLCLKSSLIFAFGLTSREIAQAIGHKAPTC